MIEFNSTTKIFPNGVKAVQDLTLTVEEGETKTMEVQAPEGFSAYEAPIFRTDDDGDDERVGSKEHPLEAEIFFEPENIAALAASSDREFSGGETTEVDVEGRLGGAARHDLFLRSNRTCYPGAGTTVVREACVAPPPAGIDPCIEPYRLVVAERQKVPGSEQLFLEIDAGRVMINNLGEVVFGATIGDPEDYDSRRHSIWILSHCLFE